MKRVIKYLIFIIPKRILPNGTKGVNGEIYKLTILERRELLERKFYYVLEKILNKYFPFRKIKKLYRSRRLESKKKLFYSLVGEIALIHAGIEQNLKNILRYNWGIEIKKVEYGSNLRKFFLKQMESQFVPENFLSKYGHLIQIFWKLSDDRNRVIKGNYAFNEEKSSIHKIQNEHFYNFDPSIPWEERINNWMPEVTLEELNILKNELQNLSNDLSRLHWEVQIDKQKLIFELCNEVGSFYPAHAFTKTYRYKAELEINDS